MEKTSATAVFESLASGIRLDVYRLLVRKGMEGLVAGEIAAALDRPRGSLGPTRQRCLEHLRRLLPAGLEIRE